MKKNILFIVMIGMLSFISCQNWLDEEPKAVAAETFYNTAAEADAAVMAPLAKLRSGFAMSYPGIMECFADYQYGRGSWEDNSRYAGLNTTNVNRTNGIWGSLYGAIRDCNIPISRLSEATELNDTQKAAYIGELKFLRAFSYYYLVRFWNAAPLRTEENMSEWNLAKSSAEDIYALIKSDLEYAVANAPDKPRLVGTPGKNIAKSLLAQVQAQLGNYTEAKRLTEEVINSGAYSLVPVTTSREFEKIFGPDVTNTPEEIFYLKSSRTNDLGWEFVMFCAHPGATIEGKKMHGAGGWYGLYTTSTNKVIAEWDVNDLRKDYNILHYNIGLGDNTYLPSKFYDPEATGGGAANVSNPLIRYADILLLYAEATTQASGSPTADAMEKLNMIHRRAYGYSPTAPSPVDFKLEEYNTKEKFINLLVREQAYENYNEAKRWPFLVRLGIAKQVIKEVKGIDVADKHFLFPIPTTEFDYNKGLDATVDQNPGY
ncbi:RagB/SusD family nutrient uptake outer membrane protein [Parabacteroides sp. Marseille-P3160]|uniref:RagB/SusD family nutrient uptake outer membrane protein n=1 Tax=Parabacteroides sp. Marseille-P3160 TaxID=1917887 RepID=UPI0009BAC4E1|nr:RagB/SusD family nutrient uptake outer membrane protein [Parabacteroides sp. Marseille-P3160]